MATNRLIGDYPVIGIRPTIDGRRGVLKVRESLEEQTMGMAKAAAKLFTENLKYSNGEPVKVVHSLSDTGLLKDNFRYPDYIRIGRFPPGQHPLIRFIPGQQNMADFQFVFHLR